MNMKIIKEVQAVRLVTQTYARICADLLNVPCYKLPMPSHNSQVFSNCVDYFFVCESYKISIRELMVEGVALFSGDWLIKTFGKPYPPLSVITSKKCLAKALKYVPLLAKPASERENVSVILDRLRGIDSKTVDYFLDNDIFGIVDPGMKEKIRKELRG